jgi:formate dehydrogenase major subunit
MPSSLFCATVRKCECEAVLPARISAAVKPGELFATFHATHVFLNRDTGVEYDTITDAPGYKVTAVRVENVTTGRDTAG